MDLNHLKELAQERLLRHLDHKNLNLDVPWFRDLDPHVREHRRGLLAGAACRASGRSVPASPPVGDTEELCRLRRRLRRALRPGRSGPCERRSHLEPFADKVRDILARARRGSGAGRAGQDAGAGRVVAPVPHPGLPACRSPRSIGRRGVRGAAPEHDHGARHRALLAVRAPPAAVLRPGPRRLHPQRQDPRPLQGGPHRGRLRPAAPGAGAAHRPDRRRDHGRASAHRASAW